MISPPVIFRLKKFFKWGGIAYIALATLAGTAVFIKIAGVMLWNFWLAPAPMPVYLPNGFVYTRDGDSEYEQYVIRQETEKEKWYGPLVVPADVREIMWHDKYVYGYRHGLAGEFFYFVCMNGEDCSNTQFLNEADFKALVKKKGLPEFHYRAAKNYEQLLWEQSKTDIGSKYAP